MDEGKKLTGVGVHGEGGAEAGNPPSGLGGPGGVRRCRPSWMRAGRP